MLGQICILERGLRMLSGGEARIRAGWVRTASFSVLGMLSLRCCWDIIWGWITHQIKTQKETSVLKPEEELWESNPILSRISSLFFLYLSIDISFSLFTKTSCKSEPNSSPTLGGGWIKKFHRAGRGKYLVSDFLRK